MTLESELIRRYQGAFTSEDCNEYIKYIDQFEERNILTYDTEKLTQVDNKSVNITFDYDFPAYSFLAKEIIPKFKPCIDEYIEAVNILRNYRFLTYDLKIKKIPIGGGFHQWHFENGGIAYSQRKFVLQVYLNDNFTGGSTLFEDIEIKPKPGKLIIFSNHEHLHYVSEVGGGERFVLSFWYSRPNANL